ncbi:long-chain-acyl-CoA synthetase [Dermacoccus barathri]|uniref:long-chain-acyl-CoA synthetase n=1 Tax=Dermacoccus barathri TaxID=322601 RepID=UPI0029D41120|nr:long-chain-acyl-CoA synthetase [Dermacoccus barathri]
MSTRRRVTVLDMARGMARMTPELGQVARNAPGLLVRRPTTKSSIGAVFQDIAGKQPERTFVIADEGRLTYGEANERVNRYASVLRDAGVKRGDVVGLLSHNSIDMLLVMLATVKLGAVSGLLNYNQRGDVLDHSLGILDARVVVLEESLRESLETAPSAGQQNVMTLDEMRAAADAAPAPAAHNPSECAETRGHEKAYYIFTSGTTGMPKASIMSHHRWLKSYSGLGGLGVRLRPDDTLYCCLPLYHNNAVTVALGAVLNGGASMAIAGKFSVSNFWDDIVRFDASSFVYIGELCRYLLGQPERPSERQHRVRVIVGNGLRTDIWREFQERFGIERIAEFYGASECNIAFINAYNLDETAGTCPLPHKVVRYDPDTGDALRNAKGRLEQVKTGEAGLLLAKVTSGQPFDGYTDEGETEKKLLRDGFRKGDCWFVTGDLVRRQGFQHVAFVDRLGDTFRWKGENVATTEVEAALERLPQVQDCVVYGVEVPGSDGRAGMAAVVLREDFHSSDVAGRLAEMLPKYAVPLFVREVESLEQTSTFKSRKVELRDAGYAGAGDDRVWVLTKEGYVPFYEGYPEDVAGARQP